MAYKGILNGFQLKIIMLILMVFDHIYYYFAAPAELAFMHLLARIVAPVFAYMTAQGMIYTRSRERYLMRLFAFATVMAAGNMVVSSITKINIPNNIFLSLAIGASMIYCIDKLKNGENRAVYTGLSVAAVILSFFCEGQYIVPMMTIIFYFFRENKPLMYTVYVLACGIPYLLTFAFTGRLPTQFYMIFAIIPIILYNGRRGPDNAVSKYLFYVFYPLHVWVIVFIRFYLHSVI